MNVPNFHREFGAGVEELMPDLSDLSYQRVSRGTIVPPNDSSGLSAGVYDADMSPVPESRLARGGQVIFAPAPDAESKTEIQRRPGKVLFGGYYYNHYGHFITESIARLWAISALNDVDRVIFVLGGVVPGRLRDEILHDLLPSDTPEIEVLEHSCSFDEVIVPQPGFVIRERFNQGYWRWIRRLSQRLVEVGEHNSIDTPLYLSRSNTPSSRRYAYGEREMEEGLRAAGIHVICPENLPFSEQVMMASKHKTIIGLEGSQLHSMMFTMGEKTSVQLDFRKVNPNYVMIDRVIGNTSSYLRLATPKAYEAFASGMGVAEPYIFDPQEASRAIGLATGLQISSPELTEETRKAFANSWINWWSRELFFAPSQPVPRDMPRAGVPRRIGGITYQQYQANVKCLLDAM